MENEFSEEDAVFSHLRRMPLFDCEVSTRLMNVLKKAKERGCKIDQIQDLEKFTKKELLGFVNMGKLTFIELEKVMADHKCYIEPSELKELKSHLTEAIVQSQQALKALEKWHKRRN